MPFAVIWVDLEIVILSELCQIGKHKYHMLSVMWNLKNETNELIHKTETDSRLENKLMITKEERSEGGIN